LRIDIILTFISETIDRSDVVSSTIATPANSYFLYPLAAVATNPEVG